FGHYSYVRVRLNASLIDHLTPVGVAARVAWETYPIVRGVLALALLTAAYSWLADPPAVRVLRAGGPPGGRAEGGALPGVPALYLLGIWGKWSWYPLRWSEAYFSANEAVAALALNPILFLADTTDSQAAPYDEDKVREHFPFVASLLGVDAPDPKRLDFARWVTPARKPATG